MTTSIIKDIKTMPLLLVVVCATTLSQVGQVGAESQCKLACGMDGADQHMGFRLQGGAQECQAITHDGSKCKTEIIGDFAVTGAHTSNGDLTVGGVVMAPKFHRLAHYTHNSTKLKVYWTRKETQYDDFVDHGGGSVPLGNCDRAGDDSWVKVRRTGSGAHVSIYLQKTLALNNWKSDYPTHVVAFRLHGDHNLPITPGMRHSCQVTNWWNLKMDTTKITGPGTLYAQMSKHPTLDTDPVIYFEYIFSTTNAVEYKPLKWGDQTPGEHAFIQLNCDVTFSDTSTSGYEVDPTDATNPWAV